MNNPIPQCAVDSPEWVFQPIEMINMLQHHWDSLAVESDRLAVEHAALIVKHNALRSALEWWMECTEGFEPNGWTFWLMDEAMDELLVTCKAAWDEMLRALEKTK